MVLIRGEKKLEKENGRKGKQTTEGQKRKELENGMLK